MTGCRLRMVSRCRRTTISTDRYVSVSVGVPQSLRIEGEGLILRPFTLDDVATVTAACQDEEMVKWTASIPSPYEESHARTWIQSHDDMRREQATFPFAAVDETDHLLG